MKPRFFFFFFNFFLNTIPWNVVAFSSVITEKTKTVFWRMIASGRVFVKAVGSREKDLMADDSAERPQKKARKKLLSWGLTFTSSLLIIVLK